MVIILLEALRFSRKYGKGDRHTMPIFQLCVHSIFSLIGAEIAMADTSCVLLDESETCSPSKQDIKLSGAIQ